MKMTEVLLKEMEQEALTTRKMLAIVPADKYSWKPHEKSMSLQQLAVHVAELPGWVSLALKTDELDFAAGPYTPEPVKDTKELLAYFEKNLAEGREALSKAEEKDLEPIWTMRNGDEIYDASPKRDVIRVSISQTIHHRAQLGVFLRLLNIPIPGSYGPSADDMSF